MAAQQSYTLADVRKRAEGDVEDSSDYQVQGVRLGLSAGSSTKEVVEANINGLAHDKLAELLKGLGLPPASGVSEADLKAMLKLAVKSEFWRRAWQQHPNAELARDWMQTHVDFRAQLEAMKKAVSGEADLSAAQVDDVSGQLQAFLKKNEPHSEYEDTQLFPYFKDAYPKYAQFWLEIDNQHGTFDELEKKALEAVAAASSGASGEARKSLASAVVDLANFYEGHLLLEERMLLPLWLNVSDAQMADLRARLKDLV